MTDMLKGNSNPSGYDTKYCGSYYNSNKDVLKQDFILNSSNIKQDNVNLNQDNDVPFIQEVTPEYKQYDSVSVLKIDYIIYVIKRKLNILHRITRNKELENKRIPDSVIIEREIEKRATLSIVDMLTLLKIADKDNQMTTQQKVILLSEINKKAKLTTDEKIAIVKELISINNIVVDIPSRKHLKNKLLLLYIVKESGFSIDVTKLKNYKPIMQSAEEESDFTDTSDETTGNSEKPQENDLDNELVEEISESKSTDDIIENNDVKNIEESEVIEKTTPQEISLIKIPTITKTFVNSKRHFKFGAGYIARNKTLSLLLPSGYTLDESNIAYQPNNFYKKSKATNKNTAINNSPLCITFTKNEKPENYNLIDFFNSNIIECKKNNLKYRQTVISKSPAVLKHRAGRNIYKASVFMKNASCVYDIEFRFKKNIANQASTVNRILASLKFEGM
ncbi:MAG: hypothetical protein UHK60_13145 [Acutalibacteraceae bacterium]|nr:hypothetical protein [Acutalibacteraceae bacterium]